MGEAIAVGVKMQAKNLLLTHFSQRYPKLPNISGVNGEIKIGVAFDCMRIPFDDFWKLPYYNDALQELFSKTDLDK